VLAIGLPGFNVITRAHDLPRDVNIRPDDKGGNPAAKTAVYRAVTSSVKISKCNRESNSITIKLVVIDYNCMLFLVSAIDLDYSKKCSRLRLPHVR